MLEHTILGYFVVTWVVLCSWLEFANESFDGFELFCAFFLWPLTVPLSLAHDYVRYRFKIKVKRFNEYPELTKILFIKNAGFRNTLTYKYWFVFSARKIILKKYYKTLDKMEKE